jgi:ABC-type multidrug transport system ATPase subunit
MKTLEFINVSKSFGEKSVLDGLYFTVEQGEKIALVGNSGTGKTTIFNLILKFIEQDSGDILLFGENINSKTNGEIRSKISWLPQSYDKLGKGKVEDYIKEISEIASLNEDIMPKFISYMKELNLGVEYAKANFNELSGGEKQRIFLAIALLLERELILLDEAGSALDESNLDSMKSFLKKSKSTVIIISHSKSVIDFCDRIIEL